MTPPKAPESSLEIAERGESKDTPIRREELKILTEPSGRVAEQFRSLRNSIQSMNPDGAPRNLVVTSATPGEGKTTCVLNLALSFAELPHMSVLVIDGNLHKPAVEARLGLPRRQGLAELFTGKLDPDRAVRETHVRGLFVMGAGGSEGNPAQYLGTDRMSTLLQMLKQRFDYVIVDAPATLDFNDASQVAAMADGTLLAVRLGETPKHLVEQAVTLLEGLGANLLGTTALGAE
jgi:capsular exopolysaccharide synthesis family protein